MRRHYCVYDYAYMMEIYSFKIISFYIATFFHFFEGKGRDVGAWTLSYLPWDLFFTAFYGQFSFVPSVFLLKAFPSDPASSEKSGVQIIPLSLYFLSCNKIISLQHFLRAGKK